MITRLLLALVFFFVAVPHSISQTSVDTRLASAWGAMMPMLRSSVVVTSDLVTLGDLFDNAGRHAETPVFRAPAPGTRGDVPAHMVLDAARSAGLERVDLAGISSVSVERAGTVMTGADLEALLQAALNDHLAQMHGEGAGSYAITLVRSPATMTLPAEQTSTLQVDLLIAPTGRNERFSARIRTARGQDVATLDGRAEHRISIPVLGRAVGRGDVVRESDLRSVDVAYNRTVGTPTLIDRADIIGQAANRSLRAGAPISPDDLTAPLMVERQELVTLVYRNGALALTVRARSMDDGSDGQSIDVMNLQSNRVVRGIVAGHGLVHVLGPMQDIALNSPLASSPNAEPIQ